jgi:hypothetical protein
MEHEKVKTMEKVIWYKINVQYSQKLQKMNMVNLGYDIIKGIK